MGRSLTQVAQSTSSGGGVGIDAWSQPCFTVYSMEHSNGGGGFFTYDHNLNLLSNVRGSGSNHYGSYRTYNDQASEFMQNYASQTHYETTGTSNSNSERPSLTSFVGYLGHITFSPAQPGGFGGWLRNGPPGSDRNSDAFRDVAVIVNEPKQDYAWFIHHGGGTHQVRFSQRSSATYYNDREAGYGGYLNISCAWSQSMYGGGCYNKKTKKMLFMETNTSYTFRPVVYSGVPDIRAVATNMNINYNKTEQYNATDEHNSGELYDYFNNSSNRTTYNQSSGKPTNNTSEDNYRCVPVLCDNDKVVMFQMIPHWGAWVCRWDASGNSEGQVGAWSWTTSYGYETGRRWGVRWQVSSDGRYVMAYCPSYYYGSGIYAALIRVSDGKFLHMHVNDSTYGMQFAPLGRSDWILNYSINTDGGHGMYYRVIRSDREMTRRNDTENFNGQDNMRTYMIDTPFYSTSYAALIPAYYDTSLFWDDTGMTHGVPDANKIGQ